MTERTTLYPFQVQGVKKLHEFDGRALLADDVGLGKTAQSLFYTWRYASDDPGPVVIVVPAHLRLNWRDEAMKHLGLKVEVLYGQRVPGGYEPSVDADQVFVIGANTLAPPHWKARTVPPPDSWVHWLAQQRPRMLIGDEGHIFKEPTSARTRAFRRLARVTPRTLILTGTPMVNTPKDLWSLLNILLPKQYPSQFDFCSEYTNAQKRWYGWDFKGARNLDKLHQELTENCMIRRLKQDVLADLPLVQHSVVPLEVPLREYKRAEDDFLAWLDRDAPEMAKSAAKIKGLARVTGLRRLAGRIKVPAVLDWVRGFREDTGHKLLVGLAHYAVSDALIAAFPARNCTLVDGRVSGDEKHARFKRFNTDPECDFCFANIEAAGTGWSCTATSDAALAELPWRPGDVAQFIGRVAGIGRGVAGRGSHLRYLLAEDTVDADIAKLLQQKSTWAATAIDGDAAVSDLDLYDQIVGNMKTRRK